ncbi:thioredoxin domain-containing protein [Curtobacterium sp. AB7]|uniref:DsbA family protein n=1 Tax=Curtobacterium sp. AB7 TaxID=3349327 RepID=UPI0019677743|nr:thioredoxin domain-containing protein [Curtobacterium sp. 24E2]
MSDNETKKARRNAARERAREARQKEQARRRRNRIALVSAIVVGSLAIVTAVVLIISSSIQPAGPGPKNMASDGILLKGQNGKIVAERTKAIAEGGKPTATKQDNSVANITVYEDYLCPICNQFETGNMEQIKKWVKDGSATLEVHPFNLLDRSSLGSKYSTRSAAAAACVANYAPDKFLDVNTALYANQPQEGTRGLTNAELASVVKQAGVTSKDVASCITNQNFQGWVGDATDRVLTEPLANSDLPKLTGTPTVIVNGKQYNGDATSAWSDANAFAAFVEQNGGSK